MNTPLFVRRPLPASMAYVVAVDGGGTSTRARVWRRSGQLVGEGRAGASGLIQGCAQAWLNIGLAIDHAMSTRIGSGWPQPSPSNTAIALGLAGANNPDWAELLLQTNPGYVHIDLHSDALTALHGAHGGRAGALVIVGTGSVGMALETDGTLRSVGGWGFPGGDEGSGADLGLQALRLTQQAMDGRIAPSLLTDLVGAHVGGDPDSLLDWCCRATQNTYASCAPMVFAAAPTDARAQRLITRAVYHLSAMVSTLDPHKTLPVVVSGSVGQRLIPRLHKALFQRVRPAQGDAMQGAAQLLLHRLGCD